MADAQRQWPWTRLAAWFAEAGRVIRTRWKIPRYSVNFPEDFDPSFQGFKDYMHESVMFYKNNPSSLRKEILSGFTVAIVQVPESIAFSFVTGVPPLFGLYATVFLAFITAAIGGGPGMISGAQGAIAVVMADLVSDSGPLSDLGR
eukprot:551489_1